MTAPQAQTITEQNKHLLARWFEEVWNQGRREAITELYAPDCILHDGSKTLCGREEFLRFYDNLRAEFSRFHISCGPVLAEDDLASTRWSAECIHNSGKIVRLSGISIVQFRDGQCVEAWQNYDEAAIAVQLES
jgi:predicted ester cyclase